MTNREYLNSLSDEEFAHDVLSGYVCCYCVHDRRQCKAHNGVLHDCDKGIEKWLKREHKDEE